MILLRLPELEDAERAEDFFEALGVPYDRELLAVHRTRLLRLFGQAVAAVHDSFPLLGEVALRAAVRRALREAYAGLSDAGAGRPVPTRRETLVQLGRRRPATHSFLAGPSGEAPGGGHFP